MPWIKTPLSTFVSSACPAPWPASPCRPSPRRPSHWGQKEVSTQHARCWIGCYFSRSTGPNPAQGGGRGLWGQDMQGWGERAEFSCVLSICNLVTNREKWVSEGEQERAAWLWAPSQAPRVLSPLERRGKEL
uniref:Uncharacterized protein n=1 Tax=Myotis myotis TaxID=51298 RepID=A0A7J7Y113_MYOMY|nr:hypothetical protein mMyoMyo1_011518 [Myotis myotis]